MFGLKAQSNFQLFQSYYVKGCLHKHNNGSEPRQRRQQRGRCPLASPACMCLEHPQRTGSSGRAPDGNSRDPGRKGGVCVRCSTHSPACEGRQALHSDPGGSERWAISSCLKINKGERRIPHLGRGNLGG